MNEYTNKPCGQCGESFTENDDVAVCPDCGTPIHRSCWNGHCPNEDKHGSFEWEKKTNEKPKNVADKSICAICGKDIGERFIVCQDCGTAMHFGCYMKQGSCPNEDKHDEMENDEEFHENNLNVVYINSENSFAEKIKKHPLRDRETGEPLTCHGVTQSELLYFLGQHYLSTPRYMGMFIRMAMTRKRICFNLWQGLLTPFYQFYQKMFGAGILLAILNFILNIPSLMLNARMEESGVQLEEFVISQSQAEIISICTLVGILVKLLIALFGDFLYMKWTVSRILTLREKYKDLPEEEYYALLEKKGNPRWGFAVLGIAVTYLMFFVFERIILEIPLL